MAGGQQITTKDTTDTTEDGAGGRPAGVVLASFLAQTGRGSRRRCAALIEAGQVTVDGAVVTLPGTRFDPARAVVCVGGQPVQAQALHYRLLHKPRGYVCTLSDPYAKRLVTELLPLPPGLRLFPIGRLDRDSEGLLLFTNDGDLANRLLHPRYGLTKEYEVTVHGRIRPEALARLTAGIEDLGERLRAQSVEVVERGAAGGVLRVVVAEGKKHEVRRLCRHARLRVERLVRVRFGPLALGEFRPAFQRELTAAEVAALRAAAGV